MQHNADIEIDDDEIIDYVKNNLDIDDVFDDEAIKNYISRQFLPEDVFDDASLTVWAADHGFIKE